MRAIRRIRASFDSMIHAKVPTCLCQCFSGASQRMTFIHARVCISAFPVFTSGTGQRVRVACVSGVHDYKDSLILNLRKKIPMTCNLCRLPFPPACAHALPVPPVPVLFCGCSSEVLALFECLESPRVDPSPSSKAKQQDSLAPSFDAPMPACYNQRHSVVRSMQYGRPACGDGGAYSG